MWWGNWSLNGTVLARFLESGARTRDSNVTRLYIVLIIHTYMANYIKQNSWEVDSKESTKKSSSKGDGHKHS